MTYRQCNVFLDEDAIEAIEVIGAHLIANGINVENPKHAGEISRSAVLRYLAAEMKRRIVSQPHVINEAFLTGGNS
jgi:hypothetical protein